MSKKIALGLMSGTSCDGVDAALIETDGENHLKFFGGLTVHYDDDLRSRLLEAGQYDVPITDLLKIEKEFTALHVEAIEKICREHPDIAKKIDVIGFHGHTIRHIPSDGLTMQIGNPWQISAAVGIPVVSDFRRADVASGGQGAPLAAVFHRALFSDVPRPTLVLNLGGVANVTWLGDDDEIIAGDTGPGCGLIDEWVQTMADLPHDVDGRLAAAGTVDQEVVEAALSAPFFAKPLPKSADRYDFDHVDVSQHSIEDGAATLCAVTAEAVSRALAELPKPVKTTWVTGGGVHHPVLMKLLGERLGKMHSVSERGLNPDTLEAECFAWLAVRRLLKLPLTVPQTTGCKAPICGGVIAEAF